MLLKTLDIATNLGRHFELVVCELATLLVIQVAFDAAPPDGNDEHLITAQLYTVYQQVCNIFI